MEDRTSSKEVVMRMGWSIIMVLLMASTPVAAEQDGYRSAAVGLEQQDQPISSGP